MLPIRDAIPTRRVPVVNYALIALNVLVFLAMWLTGTSEDTWIYRFAMIPANYLDGVSLGEIGAIFSSMFMHAGLAHLDLGFYLVGGVAASLLHLLLNPASTTPTVGASGAIAAVLGAYLVLYPQSRIDTFIPIGHFMHLTVLPAIVVLGGWFLLQLLYTALSLGSPDVGGVAFGAHVGGFVSGMIMAKVFTLARPAPRARAW
jgi:membrane associated rhomboid family serine protease